MRIERRDHSERLGDDEHGAFAVDVGGLPGVLKEEQERQDQNRTDDG
jgi:hypothetical protein